MLLGLDSERVPAKIIGYDKILDLALLKVEIKSRHVFTSAGPINVALGTKVTAIGSPGGLSGSITSGIVFSTSRDCLQIGDALQIETPLNPGNSGGPILDENGQLIGIVFAGME